MAALKLATGLALAFGLGIFGSAAAEERPGAGFFDAAPLDDPAFGRCAWMTRTGPFVFQESDYIRGYFEPTNLAAYQQALPAPFTMPARPVVRVTFLDFYDMASGPTYLETEVSILGMDGTQPGWVVLTLPVTSGSACIGGRDIFGLVKVMRRITLTRAADRYVGTLYARGVVGRGLHAEEGVMSLLGARDSGRASLSRQKKIAPLEWRVPSNES